MTVVNVAGGVFGGCCQVILVLDKSSFQMLVIFIGQDGVPKTEGIHTNIIFSK